MNGFYRSYLDEEVERRGTNCEKWDRCREVFGSADVLPMWVADMDFRTVPAVQQALVERAQHAIYGYTENAQNEKLAECGWIARRYGLNVDPEWILYSPGVVDSIFFCVRCLTRLEDPILIQPPVYGPFFRAVETFRRTLVENPLIHDGDEWKMDFAGMEAAFARGVKLMILCNPHNPVGRVWTRDELQKVVDLANKYNVIIICDEIHADFNLSETPHTRILSLEGSENCVMLTSATKSFNLVGLRQSSVIVKNEKLREKIRLEIERAHANTPNIFGAIAQMTAYLEGDAWMDAVVEYVRENRDYVADFVAERIPEIKCPRQDGTYLMWLDCRGVGVSPEQFQEKLVHEAHLALNPGTDYGAQGEGFFRLNLATNHARVVEAMERMEALVRGMRK